MPKRAFAIATISIAAAAALWAQSRNIGSEWPTAQGDAMFLDILARMGCDVVAGDEITVTGGDLRGGVFDCNSSPDIVPTLAAIAPLGDHRCIPPARPPKNELKKTGRLPSARRQKPRPGSSKP